MVLLQKETCNLRHLIHLCHPVCIERMQVHTFACTHSRICSRAHTQAQQQIHESAHTNKSYVPTIHKRLLFINSGKCKVPMTKKSCASTIHKRPLFINSGTCKFPMTKKSCAPTIHKRPLFINSGTCKFPMTKKCWTRMIQFINS